MTPEQMRIAIAEERNLNEVRWDDAGVLVYGIACRIPVPDYPNDLNAMNEVLAGLDFSDLVGVVCHLEDIMYEELSKHRGSDAYWSPIVRASAAQLAEAFCRYKYPERFKS